MLKQPNITTKMKKKAKLVSQVFFLHYKLFIQENPYQKIKLIGQGTFGKVFLAKNKKNNQFYAIKQVLQDPKYKNRELSIISRIEHQNIIYMIDYFIKVQNSDCYLNIVMDFIPNSLNHMIKEQRKQKKSFHPIQRKIIIFQIFKALYYMQLNNICHRDLKPPNILVNDQTLQVKICDFGSAKIIQKNEKNVCYICSRYYRAPQLILGSTSYGTQIDVWSVGCILIEFLTLQPIFPGDSSIQQLIEIIKILGTPPQNLIKIYEQINLTQLPLPKLKANSWQKILKKYNPEPQFVDLISKILTYDVQNRLKPIQILIHPYFHDLLSYKEAVKQLPNLLNFNSLNNRKNKIQIGLLNKFYQSIQSKNNKSIKNNELTLKNRQFLSEMKVKQQTQASSTFTQNCQGNSIIVQFKEIDNQNKHRNKSINKKSKQILIKQKYYEKSLQKKSSEDIQNVPEQYKIKQTQKTKSKISMKSSNQEIQEKQNIKQSQKTQINEIQTVVQQNE